jgi:hypothetical protein
MDMCDAGSPERTEIKPKNAVPETTAAEAGAVPRDANGTDASNAAAEAGDDPFGLADMLKQEHCQKEHK